MKINRITTYLLFFMSLCWATSLFGQQRELIVNDGHYGSVESVSFSEDCRYMASGSRDYTIKIWEVSTGRLLQTFEGHDSTVWSVSISEDGQYLASGSADNTVKVWEVSTGRLLWTLKGHSRDVNSVSFSGDGRFLASGSRDNTVKVWGVSTGNLLYTYKYNSSYVYSVNFSRDNRYLASGGADNIVKVWEVSTGRLLWTPKGHSSSVNSVSFSGDGRFLASGSSDNTVKVWEIPTGRLLHTFEGHSNIVNSVSFSGDGRYLATGSSDNTIKVWEVSTKKLLYTLGGHNNRVKSVSFSSDGRYLSSGSGDNTVKLWKMSTGRLIRTIEGSNSTILSISFSENGQYLAMGSYDNTVKLWEASTGLILRTLEGHSSPVNSVSFSGDNQYVASGSSDNTVKVWRVSTGRLLSTLEGHGGVINSVSFSFDGQYLASGGRGNTVKIWEVSTGRLLHILEGHISDIHSVSFSLNSQYLASGGRDNTVKIWEASTGRLLHTLEGHNSDVNSVNFSKNNRYMASGSTDSTVKVWEVSTGRLLRTLEGHSSSVNSVSFSKGDRYLASGSSDNTVKVWQASTGKLLNSFNGLGRYVKSIGFSGNSQYLAFVSLNSEIVEFREVMRSENLLTLQVFDKGVANIVLTSNGQYDGNYQGLEYLYYVEGARVIPLPKNDPNYVKGLMTKMLKGESIHTKPIVNPSSKTQKEKNSNPPKVAPVPTFDTKPTIQLVAKLELDFIQPFQNTVVNTSNFELKVLVKNLKNNVLVLKQNQQKIPHRLNGKFLMANVQLLEGENTFTLQTQQNGKLISTSIQITYQKPKPIPHFRSGKDHALFFAVKDYEHWGDLRNPIRDVEAIGGELRSRYGFDTTLIYNPTHQQIYQTLTEVLARQYDENEQLFVYFTGHGDTTKLGLGYFIPREAQKGTIKDYFPYATIKKLIERGNCHHVFLVIDACYSSSADDLLALSKSKDPDFEADFPFQNRRKEMKLYIREGLSSKSHILLTSGLGKTSDGSRHSPMTIELLEILGNPPRSGLLSIRGLREQLQDNMNSRGKGYEKPHFGQLPGHENGRFFFISLDKQ